LEEVIAHGVGNQLIGSDHTNQGILALSWVVCSKRDYSLRRAVSWQLSDFSCGQRWTREPTADKVTLLPVHARRARDTHFRSNGGEAEGQTIRRLTADG
jgi:hypothetical protein